MSFYQDRRNHLLKCCAQARRSWIRADVFNKPGWLETLKDTQQELADLRAYRRLRTR